MVHIYTIGYMHEDPGYQRGEVAPLQSRTRMRAAKAGHGSSTIMIGEFDTAQTAVGARNQAITEGRPAKVVLDLYRSA